MAAGPGLRLSDDDTYMTKPRRLSPERIAALRAMDSQARKDTIADLIACGFAIMADADEDKYALGAGRLALQAIDLHQREDKHVGAETAQLAEKHAELLKEMRALKRGSGPLAGTLPEGDEGDSPVH